MGAAKVAALPVEIVYNDVRPDEATEQELHRAVKRLAGCFPDLCGCRVVVEPADRPGRGYRYRVRLDLTLPSGGFKLGPPATPGVHRHDFTTLVHQAVDHARRELASHVHRSRSAGRLF